VKHLAAGIVCIAALGTSAYAEPTQLDMTSIQSDARYQRHLSRLAQAPIDQKKAAMAAIQNIFEDNLTKILRRAPISNQERFERASLGACAISKLNYELGWPALGALNAKDCELHSQIASGSIGELEVFQRGAEIQRASLDLRDTITDIETTMITGRYIIEISELSQMFISLAISKQ